jgi:hypothetical protein
VLEILDGHTCFENDPFELASGRSLIDERRQRGREALRGKRSESIELGTDPLLVEFARRSSARHRGRSKQSFVPTLLPSPLAEVDRDGGSMYLVIPII